jgi:hypothetical protein
MEFITDRLATRGLVFLIGYAALRSVFRAAAKPFWYDELCTLTVARQAGASGIWSALEHGVDSHPPVFYLMERAAGKVVPNAHIAFRLPSILGFCCVLLCVFIFVRKRSGSRCALLCAAVPLMSVLYDPYAVEARGYGLVTAFLAIALVCYQRADAVLWAFLLGLSLAFAGASHYYAVFALVPFFVAETVASFEKGKIRPGVWLALFCGAVPLAVFWPLLSRLKEYYGPHFWGQFSLAGVPSVYGWFFGVSAAWGFAIAAAALLGTLVAMAAQASKSRSADVTDDVPLHEYALALAMLALPLVLYTATKVTHGGLINRYMVPTVLGFPVAAGCILPRFNHKLTTLLGVLLIFGLAGQEVLFWAHERQHLGQIVSPANAVEELVNEAGYRDLPVVVADGHDYLQLVHYEAPEWAGRFVCLVDEQASVAYAGNDSLDKELLLLQLYLPLHLYQFRDFTARHPDFLLYSAGGEWDWWPVRLLHDGYPLRLVAIRENHRVYLVSAKIDKR